ncbi:MAG: AAA family ATPase, partial [Candidatus Electrothrix sp. AX5]|nr:AAA family ATPase [Candidatus Electrothrix sp. AX5]
MILSLNFSLIELNKDIQRIERNFQQYCNGELDALRDFYPSLLAEMPEVIMDAPVAENLTAILRYLKKKRLPPLYIIIDEYDNFANQLVV